MKKRLLVTCALAGALFLAAAVPALAETMPTPGGGPDFGQHIVTMAQAGPQNVSAMMGGMTFGQIVSAMAHGS